MNGQHRISGALKDKIHNLALLFKRVVRDHSLDFAAEAFALEERLHARIVCGAVPLPALPIVALQEDRTHAVNGIRKPMS